RGKERAARNERSSDWRRGAAGSPDPDTFPSPSRTRLSAGGNMRQKAGLKQGDPGQNLGESSGRRSEVDVKWYSYAVVRVVPRVERGEFLNVGVVLFSRELDFLSARFELDEGRLRSLAPDVDTPAVERHLATFRAISDGTAAG